MTEELNNLILDIDIDIQLDQDLNIKTVNHNIHESMLRAYELGLIANRIND